MLVRESNNSAYFDNHKQRLYGYWEDPGPQSIKDIGQPKPRKNCVYEDSWTQQLSLKHRRLSGQWHLVPTAPEAYQILCKTTTHIRCQETR